MTESYLIASCQSRVFLHLKAIGDLAMFTRMPQEPTEEMRQAFMSIEGWIDLRNYDEAANELHNLPPDWKSTTPFVKCWIRIYEAQEAWSNVEMLATTLNNKKPKDLFGISKLAESFFQQGRHGDAISKLGEALSLERGAEYPLVRYHLARYFAGAGQFNEAREHLKAAIKLDKNLKSRALDDPDLEKFWTELQDGFK